MPSDPDLREFKELTEAEDLRRALATAQDQLRRAKARSEDLVAATMQGAHDAMLALGPVTPVAAPVLTPGAGTPEVALWHLTDWQGSKVTTTYNSDVMRARVLRYVEKAEKITEIMRTDHPVDECVILFGGDMCEGLFNFPQQPFEIDASLFEQYARAARLEVDVIRRALAIYTKVTVISEWGNHGRVGSKRAAVPRADNFDRMTYALARGVLEDQDRLTWEDSEEDIRQVEVGNYRALLIHGDEIGRNGYASPATILTHIAKWKSGSHPWAFRDVYMGHYHTHGEDSLPDGEGALYRTGSPESDNRYANITMAASSAPSQRLNFIDPEAGRVTYPCRIWLEG
jgi:hypothetical protein